MRIDAHHHLWTLSRGDYGWLTPELAPIYRDFRLSDLAPHLSVVGIEGTILVQAAPTERETMFLLDIADNTEWCAAWSAGRTSMQPTAARASMRWRRGTFWWDCGRWCRTSPTTIGCLVRH
jgi:predicted TIM-barrel fold metal-dependent hydrolase